jgi:hypothetical protein
VTLLHPLLDPDSQVLLQKNATKRLMIAQDSFGGYCGGLGRTREWMLVALGVDTDRRQQDQL